jgi:FkbM family methyltransferase
MSYARLVAGRSRALVPLERGGLAASVDLRTSHGLGIYRYREYEDVDFDVLRTLLRPGDVFVDCGANVGMYTLTAAKLVGPTGRVIAFEPAPPTRNALVRNVAANDLHQVTVLPYALGDRSGSMPFTVMGDGGGLSSFAPENAAEGDIVTVPVARLDDCVPPDVNGRVRLVKMDVEGAETAALRGAEGLFQRERPLLLLEVEDAHLRRQGSSADELNGLLSGWGYVGKTTSGPSPNVLYYPRS